MESRISATQAAERFSEILDRVQNGREEFLVEQGGEPICRIAPVAPNHRTLADLADLLDSLPKVDEEYLLAVEQAARQQPEMPGSPWEH